MNGGGAACSPSGFGSTTATLLPTVQFYRCRQLICTMAPYSVCFRLQPSPAARTIILHPSLPLQFATSMIVRENDWRLRVVYGTERKIGRASMEPQVGYALLCTSALSRVATSLTRRCADSKWGWRTYDVPEGGSASYCSADPKSMNNCVQGYRVEKH